MSAARDADIARNGRRALSPLGDHRDQLGSLLVKNGALGLIMIDATALLEIERLYGARPFRVAIEGLTQRVRARISQEIGDEFLMTSGALEEEYLLVFLSQPRSARDFYLHELVSLADDLRAFIALSLRGIVYPYLQAALHEVPVGCGISLHRVFQRPEIQIRRLIESTRATAHFEREQQQRRDSELLRRVILSESLTTVFEPIVRLSDRSVIGYEALSRGPESTGLRSPLALFSVAEACDLEFELDNLCRRQALRNARGIQPDQRLFLNILPGSVHDPDFAGERIAGILQERGLAPGNLVLEISERQAIRNFPIFREAIDHFAKLGFGIALDDTGAGFSNLEAALELTPDYLKIDMALVRGIEDSTQKQELLRGLQNLGREMGSILIAEGIETRHELSVIQELGIECGQGFYLGRGTHVPGSQEGAESD